MTPRSTTRRLPSRWNAVVFGALLSALMTVVVSGISTLRSLGWEQFSVVAWALAFVSSWPIAFPTVLVVAPLVRRMVGAIVEPAVPSEPTAPGVPRAFDWVGPEQRPGLTPPATPDDRSDASRAGSTLG